MLGLRVSTRGDPETIASLEAFHAKRHQLTAKHLPRKPWEIWRLFAAPVLFNGSWGWLWCMDLRGKIDALVYRMARVIHGIIPRDHETRVDWKRRYMCEASRWVWKFEKSCYAQQILLQCGRVWSSWVSRDRMSGMMSWRWAARSTFATDPCSIVGPRRTA